MHSEAHIKLMADKFLDTVAVEHGPGATEVATRFCVSRIRNERKTDLDLRALEMVLDEEE